MTQRIWDIVTYGLAALILVGFAGFLVFGLIFLIDVPFFQN